MSVNAADNLDPVYLREYEAHYSHVNVFVIHGKDQMLEGRVFTGSRMCPQNVVVGSEYYNDCLRRYDLLHPMGAVILQTQSLASLLTSWRSKTRGEFDDDDSALLYALLPHLRRAVEIHRRLDQVTFERDSAAGMLDRLAVGTILTNRDGEVILVNRAAAMIIDALDGLRIKRHQLTAERHGETVALAALIAQAAQISNGEGTGAGGRTLTLSRPSGLRPLELLVSPFPARDRRQLSLSQPAAVAVFVTDPEQRPLVPEEMLRALYHLDTSRSGARIAAGAWRYARRGRRRARNYSQYRALAYETHLSEDSDRESKSADASHAHRTCDADGKTKAVIFQIAARSFLRPQANPIKKLLNPLQLGGRAPSPSPI